MIWKILWGLLLVLMIINFVWSIKSLNDLDRKTRKTETKGE